MLCPGEVKEVATQFDSWDEYPRAWIELKSREGSFEADPRDFHGPGVYDTCKILLLIAIHTLRFSVFRPL